MLFDEKIFPFARSNSLEIPKIVPSAMDKEKPAVISLPTLPHKPLSESLILVVGATTPPSPLVDLPLMSAPSQVSQLPSPPLNSSKTQIETQIASHVSKLPNHTESRTHNIVTRSMNNIYKPKKLFLVTKHPIPLSLEPTNVNQALPDPRWCDAKSSELTALMHHGTWQLVLPPQGCNIIGCKWIFRVKQLADGSIDWFKVRLMAKDFNQRLGLDYTQTFSPVVKQVTIQTMLSIVVMHGWPLRQLDVNNAFLHYHLTEEVYMT